MRLLLIAILCLFFSGCGVRVIPRLVAGIPTESEDVWRQVETKISGKDATIEELVTQRTKEVRVLGQAQQRIASLDKGISEAREREVAGWIYLFAGLCGVIAALSMVLFFVFPAFGAIERGLATGCGIAACALWWVGAHVALLPWVGGSILLIGAGVALLGGGHLSAILARLRGTSSAIHEVVGRLDSGEVKARLSDAANGNKFIQKIRNKLSKI